MNNMTEYLKWRGDIPMEAFPLCEADWLVMAQLAYIPFDDVVKDTYTPEFSVGQAADAVLERLSSKDGNRIINFSENSEFLHEIINSPRFSALSVCAYRNIFSVEEQEQFCAVTFLLPDGTPFIAFRGTDSTLVGWKEDFNMAFSDAVPAQLDAVKYIEQTSRAFPDKKLLVCGHSKGGNLAVYGSAFCEKEVQDKISAVRNLDGPGFSEKVISREGFVRILDRTETVIPASSIVGILLEHAESFTVIRSYASATPFQHDPFTWEISRCGYVPVENISDVSKYIDATLKHWVDAMPEELRESFINGLYNIISSAGIDDVREIFSPRSVIAILKSLKNADSATGAVLSEAMGLFQKAAGTGFPAFAEKLKNSVIKTK
ncbi:MAG: DUF2974 domain-containing protein [Clostridia bacterium]|nr:DUF2974 domain-containing protein [Clostridia bacterium]